MNRLTSRVLSIPHDHGTCDRRDPGATDTEPLDEMHDADPLLLFRPKTKRRRTRNAELFFSTICH